MDDQKPVTLPELRATLAEQNPSIAEALAVPEALHVSGLMMARALRSLDLLPPDGTYGDFAEVASTPTFVVQPDCSFHASTRPITERST